MSTKTTKTNYIVIEISTQLKTRYTRKPNFSAIVMNIATDYKI